MEELSDGVFVFGQGVRAIGQITLETNYLIQQMGHVFHLSTDERVSSYLRSINVNHTSLSSLYESGQERKVVYQKIADIIVTTAKTQRKVGFLTTGNPIFLNSVVEILKANTLDKEILFHIYPSVSSIDTILNDLFLPVGSNGLQCYECNHFITTRPRIDVGVPLLLFQPGVIGYSKIRTEIEGNIEGLETLESVLREYYDPGQIWLLVNSSGSSSEATKITTGTIASLSEKAKEYSFNRGSLLIPGEWTPPL